MRGLADTVGFAHLDRQMDEVMKRIKARDGAAPERIFREKAVSAGDRWRMAIAPHDDYAYVGSLYPLVLANIKACTVIVFGVIWIFYRRVVSAEAAREARLERAANIRRVYTYLIAAIGLAMIAIGAAGTLGVLGSMGMGINTHSHGETATYIALLLVGAPAWGFAWFQVVRGLSDDERRSLPRRTYLYLVIGGSVIALLVFVSAILYRLLNATLAGSFGLGLWHDVWHLTVDAGVSAGAFLFHLGVLRGDRRAQVTAAPEPTEHSVTVLVRAIDAATARARVASALGSQTDITVR